MPYSQIARFASSPEQPASLSPCGVAEKLYPSHSPVSGPPRAPVSHGNRSDFAGMVA